MWSSQGESSWVLNVRTTEGNVDEDTMGLSRDGGRGRCDECRKRMNNTFFSISKLFPVVHIPRGVS